MAHPADGALPVWLWETDYAHRGLYGDGVPENSLPAFDGAVSQGLGIELDVRLTADGVPVVVHDDDLEVATGIPGRVGASDLRDLEELRLRGGRDTGIPTLAAALALIGGRVPVMVELKSSAPSAGRLEIAVARVLDDYGGPVTVASFNPVTVAWFARHRPELPRGQIAGRLADARLPGALRAALRRLAFNLWTRPHYVSYQLDMLSAPAAQRWRDRGRLLVAWTASTAQDVRRGRRLADTLIIEGDEAVAAVTGRPGP